MLGQRCIIIHRGKGANGEGRKGRKREITKEDKEIKCKMEEILIEQASRKNRSEWNQECR